MICKNITTPFWIVVNPEYHSSLSRPPLACSIQLDVGPYPPLQHNTTLKGAGKSQIRRLQPVGPSGTAGGGVEEGWGERAPDVWRGGWALSRLLQGLLLLQAPPHPLLCTGNAEYKLQAGALGLELPYFPLALSTRLARPILCDPQVGKEANWACKTKTSQGQSIKMGIINV